MTLSDISENKFTNSKKETLSLKQLVNDKLVIKKFVLAYLDKDEKEQELVIDSGCSFILLEDNYHVVIRFSDKDLYDSIRGEKNPDESTLRITYVFMLQPYRITIPGGNIISLEW